MELRNLFYSNLCDHEYHSSGALQWNCRRRPRGGIYLRLYPRVLRKNSSYHTKIIQLSSSVPRSRSSLWAVIVSSPGTLLVQTSSPMKFAKGSDAGNANSYSISLPAPGTGNTRSARQHPSAPTRRRQTQSSGPIRHQTLRLTRRRLGLTPKRH